ncbi:MULTISPECIES: hypothetical protein [unclassified Mesorhizobium]|uniref:hypothetical protein n=1 Tax=Mesorhizobium sp. M6A.T.Cr.TU.014.01.1.1 TaxID=2496676 RepID=UPI0013E3030B|nr:MULTISPECIES: hypothetical protein [unclassified Mesorhizobium]
MEQKVCFSGGAGQGAQPLEQQRENHADQGHDGGNPRHQPWVIETLPEECGGSEYNGDKTVGQDREISHQHP